MKNINGYLSIILLILVAVVISATIGGNGCLWTGNSSEGFPAGSSGGLIATNPSPANAAPNVSVTA